MIKYILHQPRSAGTSLQHWLRNQGVIVKSANVGFDELPDVADGEVFFSHAFPTDVNLAKVGTNGILLRRNIYNSHRSIIKRHRRHYLVRDLGFEGERILAALGWIHYGWSHLPIIRFKDLVGGNLAPVAALFNVDPEFPFPWESRQNSKGYKE